MQVNPLRARPLVHSTLIANLRHAVPRPRHHLWPAAHHHGRLAQRALNGLPNQSLNVRARRVLPHDVRRGGDAVCIAAVLAARRRRRGTAAAAGALVAHVVVIRDLRVAVDDARLFLFVERRRFIAVARRRAVHPQEGRGRGSLLAACNGKVQVNLDAVGVGGLGGRLGTRHVVLRLGDRPGDNGNVDSPHARLLPRLGGHRLQDRHDEAGARRGADEDEPLKGIPVGGRAVRARHQARELRVVVLVLGGEVMDALREATVRPHNELDAAAAARPLQLVCARNRVGVRFEGPEPRDPEVNVLARRPLEMHILDCQHSRILPHRAGQDAVADAAPSLATGATAFAELHVLPEQVRPAGEAVKDEKRNRHPEEMHGVGGDVLVDEPEHDDGRGNVLQEPCLVGHAAEGHEADDDGPEEDGPGAEAVLDHGHDLHLKGDKVGAHPLDPEVEAVAGGGDEHGAGDPAVQPVEALVARADEEADGVELHGEEVHHGQLADGDPGVAVADALEVGGVVGDDAPGHEVDNHGPVAGEDEDAAEGRRRGPGKVSERDVVLGMAHFADEGGRCGPGLGDMAVGAGRLLDGGIFAGRYSKKLLDSFFLLPLLPSFIT